MNQLLVVLALALLGVGCDWGNRLTTTSEPLSARFTLTDTSGRAQTDVLPGENFDLDLLIVNTSGKALTYIRNSSAPPVQFEIFQGDSIVATSVDGYAFLLIMSTGRVVPGDSLTGRWRAPNTPARDVKIALAVGAYQARARFPKFLESDAQPVSPISFQIRPRRNSEEKRAVATSTSDQ